MAEEARPSATSLVAFFMSAVVLLAAGQTASGQERKPRPDLRPKEPSLHPTPTPAPLPDLIPWFTFNLAHRSTRADGTPCSIWNVSADSQNITLGPVPSSYALILERRTGPSGTFLEACPKCTFHVAGPLAGGVAGAGGVRQFNDCGYGPPYSPDFRIRVDIHNRVRESNERNNSEVRSFPRVD